MLAFRNGSAQMTIRKVKYGRAENEITLQQRTILARLDVARANSAQSRNSNEELEIWRHWVQRLR